MLGAETEAACDLISAIVSPLAEDCFVFCLCDCVCVCLCVCGVCVCVVINGERRFYQYNAKRRLGRTVRGGDLVVGGRGRGMQIRMVQWRMGICLGEAHLL